MKKVKSSIILFSLILAILVAAPPAWAKKPPTVNDDGMILIQHNRMTTVYADPDVDLSIYTSIMLMDVSVAFRKNWKRDQNSIARGRSIKVKDSDMDRIRATIAANFRHLFTAELQAGGYKLVETAGESVLLVKPAIVDLDVIAPDLPNPGRVTSYSKSAGEMTLVLELYDALTHDKIVTVKDRKLDYSRGYIDWRNKGSNRADANRMMHSWAEGFRQALDKARSVVHQ